MLVCDKCKATIPSAAKFCAQCGDPVTEADVVVTQVATVEGNAVISFGESSSVNYARAMDICKNIPTFETDQSGKKKQHKVTLSLTEVELITNVFDLVGSWKSSSMMINGRPASKKDLVYHGLGCYKSRQRAYQPQQYCFGEHEYEANIWGCKKLNMPMSQWGGGWLDYGAFNKKGAWVFDKEKIRHHLNLAIADIDLCPVLDKEHIFKTLEALPAEINPETDPRWEYRTEYRQVGNDYKSVAVGIKPVRDTSNLFVLGDYKPAWKFEDDRSVVAAEYTINVDISSALDTQKKKEKEQQGKVTWKKLLIAAVLIYILIKMFG